MSIGTVAVYGLLSRTPKFRSPLSKSKIKTPICMRPTRARNQKTHTVKDLLLLPHQNLRQDEQRERGSSKTLLGLH